MNMTVVRNITVGAGVSLGGSHAAKKSVMRQRLTDVAGAVHLQLHWHSVTLFGGHCE